MGSKSTATGLHIVGRTPVPPPPMVAPSISSMRCRPARNPMQSRPILDDDVGVGTPSSNMLLTSLCDAWHDIGDRTTLLFEALKPKSKSV